MRSARLLLVGLLTAACTPGPADLTTRTITVDGVGREYDVVAPDSASAGAPVVVVLHGLVGTKDEIRRVTGLDAAARTHGFVAVFPQALGFVPTWRADPAFGDADVRFLAALVDAVRAERSVGPVVVVGFSNGGGMAVRMACDRPDLVDGVGSVAGALGEPPCLPDRPVPLLAIHGTADPIVPFGGVPGALPPIAPWVGAWADAVRCAARVASGPVAVWQGCAAPVTLVEVPGGGHVWPGQRGTPATPSATEIIAGFVASIVSGSPVYAPGP